MLLLIFLAGAGFLVLKNSQKMSAPRSSDTLQVVASFYPLYFFATQIGGDRATVTNMVPAGAEPHDYEPTAQDMAAMEQSRLIILNGGGLEAWGDSLQKNIDPATTRIIIAGTGLTTQHMTEENGTVIDPHVWLAPPLAQQMVDRIAQGFEQVDPANAPYYQANATALRQRLNDLDTAYRQGLSHCVQQDIVTSHAAFGYLASTYGFNQVAIAGLSPDAEPSPSQLADIAAFASVKNVKYIFFESLVSPKLAQTLATEIGAQTLVLDPLEGLSTTELNQGRDYFSVMRDNLINLQTALQCTT